MRKGREVCQEAELNISPECMPMPSHRATESPHTGGFACATEASSFVPRHYAYSRATRSGVSSSALWEGWAARSVRVPRYGPARGGRVACVVLYGASGRALMFYNNTRCSTNAAAIIYMQVSCRYSPPHEKRPDISILHPYRDIVPTEIYRYPHMGEVACAAAWLAVSPVCLPKCAKGSMPSAMSACPFTPPRAVLPSKCSRRRVPHRCCGGGRGVRWVAPQYGMP